MTELYQRLHQFISTEMRMLHVYQPVMLAELLRSNGKATVSQIARAILERDATQLEYYQQITKNMVGQVLTKRRRIASKEGDSYRLDGYGALASHEVEELMSLCHKKIAQYETQRGEAIWEHRKRLGRTFSGTDRYDLLRTKLDHCATANTFPVCPVSGLQSA